MGSLNLGPDIDALIFEQILEIDDDENERKFSRSMVFDYLEQAEQTFEQMDFALYVESHHNIYPVIVPNIDKYDATCRKDKDLEKLSSLSHFLKGSSAILGLTRVEKSCEMIEHYGQQKDAAGEVNKLEKQDCVDAIEKLLVQVREKYAEVEAVLRRFYA